MVKSILRWDSSDGTQVVLFAEHCVMRLRVTNDLVLHLQANCGDVVFEEESYVAVPQNYISLNVKETESGLVFGKDDALFMVHFNPFSISGWKNGKNRFSLVSYRAMELTEEKSVLRLTLNAEEGIYGLGQDPMANLNQNGFERRMWNIYGGWRRSGNASIPFYTSSNGYGLLLNNAYPSRFCIGKAALAEEPNASHWAPSPWPWDEPSGETDSGELSIILDDKRMDVFLMLGDAPEIQEKYQKLTGKAPIPPKWALGFIQCKNRYRTQDELLQVAREYRQRNIPCDAVVIDWQWYKHTGDLDWDLDAWPDVKTMFAELKQLGYHVMQAEHPFVEKNCKNYAEFNEKGFLNIPAAKKGKALDDVAESGMPTFDHSNPEARKAWWKCIRKLAEDGIDGYWTDMGELQDHQPGTMSYLGNRERCHNLYTTFWSQGLFEGHRKDFDTRCVSLHRSAFAGSHRNGAFLWSGDVHATWEVLHDQVVIGQSVCASGQPYWCTDVGGFFGSDDFTPELYIRWLQWGVFCPVFRTHGTRAVNEVHHFSKECEKISTAFINLRYRLLPYIYSAAYRNYVSGYPLMRPMAFDFPDDKTACAQAHQFMFGDSLLIAPVTEYAKRTAEVYLPAGQWYDFWTDRVYVGGQTITVCAPLDRIPVFVKAGAIIPQAESAAHTGAMDFSKITLHVYPGSEGEFNLYEDAGEGYGYEKGEYRLTHLHLSADGSLNQTLLHEGYKATVQYEICNHSETVGANLSLCALTKQTAFGPVSVDSNLEQDGQARVHITAENCTDEVCRLHYEVMPPIAMHHHWYSAASKEIELLPVETTGQIGSIHTYLFSEKSMQLCNRAIHVQVQMCVAEKTDMIDTEIILPTQNVTNWTIVGSFDNSEGIDGGLERVYPVEQDLDRPYYRDGEKCLVPYKSSRQYDCMGYVELPHPAPKSYIDEDVRFAGVAYAYTDIFSDREQDAYLELSAEPSAKLWVNGEVVYCSSEIVLRQQLPNVVHLKQGKNIILVKAVVDASRMNAGREFGFSLRFVNAQGASLPDIYN